MGREGRKALRPYAGMDKIDMNQGEIFTDFEGVKSRESLFVKQRGRWSRNQMRVIEIMADPLNAIMTNRQIAEHCGLAESYIYKLLKDEMFLAEVDKRRKSDETLIRLRAKVWKALMFEIEKSPAKIRTALEALGDLKPTQMNNVLTVYEKLTNDEVDDRLAAILKDRQRKHEFSRVDDR